MSYHRGFTFRIISLLFAEIVYLYPVQNPKLRFWKNEVHLETPVFEILENKCCSFHCLFSEQNDKWKYAHIDCFSQHCLTVLIRTTDVDNGIHCIKGAKVNKFYVYKFKNNLSIVKIY